MQSFEDLKKFGVPEDEIEELRRTKRALSRKLQYIAMGEGALAAVLLIVAVRVILTYYFGVTI